MNETSLSRIDDFLEAASRELFLSCGIGLERAAAESARLDIPFAATIGFTSGEIHGFLVITLGRDLAARSLPGSLRSRAADDEIVADWTGELSNQLLGRLKNRFHDVGVELALSTPVIFAGMNLRHFPCDAPLCRGLAFRDGSGGAVLVELQANYVEGFEIGEGGRSGQVPDEGDVTLF